MEIVHQICKRGEPRMVETFTEFDPTEYLYTPEAIAEFMSDALETGDAGYIAKAMEVAARTKKNDQTC
jgi:probable addiction module antidote protein